MFSAVLSAFGTNSAVQNWKSLPPEDQDTRIASSLKSLANKILSILMSQKVSSRDHIDPNESAAIIAKIPLHIGSINIAGTLPSNIQHFQTKSVLFSLCGLLRSRDKSVRHTSSDVLMEIILELGKQYLNLLFQALFQYWIRGS